MINKPKVTYCKNCTYPSSSAVPLEFNEEGICSGCLTSKEKKDIDWDRRKKMFENLLDEYKSQDNYYDCIIPVSGGKDSYWQIHIIKEYGLNPLLVTYHGNNYSNTGMQNLRNMREVFGVDHIFYTPSINLLKKMNRVCQKLMGDMNWHAHAGIFTYPIRVAVEKKVPLMIWGEHGFMDLGGMHSYKDLVEFTYRYRHEHCMRGYEWYDIIEASKKYDDEIFEREMIQWKYPKDEEIEDVGVRGIYISNFFKWDANEHGPLMIEKYGFKEAEEPFERTYRKMSNLDDMHENGIHDYMKWVKFGYGRATDHTSKDIRGGRMDREQAIKTVLKRDPIKSKDLKRWLNYTGWTEQQFDEVADSFRDPNVWWIKNGKWCKKDIDGVEREYGKVHLSDKEITKYFKEN
ncbi:MAG: N-acetyl sugar amidotransferase [Candidatus Paceibacterota bacterium]